MLEILRENFVYYVRKYITSNICVLLNKLNFIASSKYSIEFIKSKKFTRKLFVAAEILNRKKVACQDQQSANKGGMLIMKLGII